MLKILIGTVKIFNESEGMHIFNDLYINQVNVVNGRFSTIIVLSKRVSEGLLEAESVQACPALLGAPGGRLSLF